MRYQKIEEGIFLKRPNRFIAHVDINGEVLPVRPKPCEKNSGKRGRRSPDTSEAVRICNLLPYILFHSLLFLQNIY